LVVNGRFSPNHAVIPPYETDARGDGVAPPDSQTYDALKIRFSAMLGEEPEVDVGLL
jgi:hypothetical protein